MWTASTCSSNRKGHDDRVNKEVPVDVDEDVKIIGGPIAVSASNAYYVSPPDKEHSEENREGEDLTASRLTVPAKAPLLPPSEGNINREKGDLHSIVDLCDDETLTSRVQTVSPLPTSHNTVFIDTSVMEKENVVPTNTKKRLAPVDNHLAGPSSKSKKSQLTPSVKGLAAPKSASILNFFSKSK